MINTVSRPQFSAGYTQKQIDEIKYLEALKKNNVDDILALFDLPKASSPLFKREHGFGDSYFVKTEYYKKALAVIQDVLDNPETPLEKVREIDQLFHSEKPKYLDVSQEMFETINRRLDRI